MKPRIRVGSIEYTLWISGLYHDNKDWNHEVNYKGLFSHTEQALNKIYNTESSSIISNL